MDKKILEEDYDMSISHKIFLKQQNGSITLQKEVKRNITLVFKRRLF